MRALIFLVFLVLTIACASWFIRGGELVKADSAPRNVVVAYEATGVVPPGARYQLVDVGGRLGMFEADASGGGVIFTTHWQDAAGDHFAGWVATGPAYEFVVPLDRNLEAQRFVYPKGSYSTRGGRPVPSQRFDPVTRLIPANVAVAAPAAVAGSVATAAPAASAEPTAEPSQPTPPPAAEPTPVDLTARVHPEAWATMKGRTVIVTMKDGTIVHGEIIGMSKKTVTIVQLDGKVSVIQKADAAQLRIDLDRSPS